MSPAEQTSEVVCLGLCADGSDGSVKAEEEEVQDYRVKCLNNLAAAVRRGAAHQQGRSDPRAKQRQGPLQGGEGEGPILPGYITKRRLRGASHLILINP